MIFQLFEQLYDFSREEENVFKFRMNFLWRFAKFKLDLRKLNIRVLINDYVMYQIIIIIIVIYENLMLNFLAYITKC